MTDAELRQASMDAICPPKEVTWLRCGLTPITTRPGNISLDPSPASSAAKTAKLQGKPLYHARRTR